MSSSRRNNLRNKILTTTMLSMISLTSPVVANSSGLNIPCDINNPYLGTANRAAIKFQNGTINLSPPDGRVMWWATPPAFANNKYTLRSADTTTAASDPTTYIPGQYTEITIRTNEQDQQFTGLLMYAVNSQNQKVGEWVLPPRQAFQIDPASGCVTHSNADPKNYKSVFRVRFPQGTGKVEIRALVKFGRAFPEVNGGFFYPNTKHLTLDEGTPQTISWLQGNVGENCNTVCARKNMGCDLATLKSAGSSAASLYAAVSKVSSCFGPVLRGCGATSPSVGTEGCFYQDSTCTRDPVNSDWKHLDPCASDGIKDYDNTKAYNTGGDSVKCVVFTGTDGVKSKWCANYYANPNEGPGKNQYQWTRIAACMPASGYPTAAPAVVQAPRSATTSDCTSIKATVEDGQRLCACSSGMPPVMDPTMKPGTQAPPPTQAPATPTQQAPATQAPATQKPAATQAPATSAPTSGSTTKPTSSSTTSSPTSGSTTKPTTTGTTTQQPTNSGTTTTKPTTNSGATTQQPTNSGATTNKPTTTAPQATNMPTDFVPVDMSSTGGTLSPPDNNNNNGNGGTTDSPTSPNGGTLPPITLGSSAGNSGSRMNPSIVLTLLSVLLTSVFSPKSGSSSRIMLTMIASIMMFTCLPSASAHNWLTSPSRANKAMENGKGDFNGFTSPPCPSKGTRVHTQVGAGQRFIVEWASGHGYGSSTYLAVIKASDEMYLRGVTFEVMDDYIKNAPVAASNYMSDSKAWHVTPNAPGQVIGNNNYASLEKDITDNPENARASVFRPFPNSAKAYTYAKKASATANDKRVSYRSDKYPYLISVHRFALHEDHSEEMDGVLMEIPAGSASGQYIVQYQWRGYYDCVDINVLPQASSAKFGDFGKAAGAGGYDVVQHTLYDPTFANYRAFDCAEVREGETYSNCMGSCDSKNGQYDACDLITVAPAILNKDIVKFPGMFNSKTQHYPPECKSVVDAIKAKDPNSQSMICYTVHAPTAPLVGPPFKTVYDPEDPVFYSTAYVKKPSWVFTESCPACISSLPPADFRFTDRCISCKDMARNFFTPDAPPKWSFLPQGQCQHCDNRLG